MKNRSGRRGEALSRERIVAAAVAILDEGGSDTLTFRALAARLATGAGAIYWHVADKQALLAAATDNVIGAALSADADGPPDAALRTLAVGVFDAIDAHPWVGAQLAGDPWQQAVLRILEGVGERIIALGIPEAARFDAATALLSFILGLAGQYAVAVATRFGSGGDRRTFLTDVAARWGALDPAAYPFVRAVAAQLPDHDDREQFRAGVDLFLTGIMRMR